MRISDWPLARECRAERLHDAKLRWVCSEKQWQRKIGQSLLGHLPAKGPTLRNGGWRLELESIPVPAWPTLKLLYSLDHHLQIQIVHHNPQTLRCPNTKKLNFHQSQIEYIFAPFLPCQGRIWSCWRFLLAPEDGRFYFLWVSPYLVISFSAE